jgi:hypothetical protein
MVSKVLSHISKIGGIISLFALGLIALYPNEIKDLITSIFGVSNKEIVLYALIGLAIFGIFSCGIILIHNWRTKSKVIIQKNSLRFNKYPFLVKSKSRMQQMPNMVYAEITVENSGRTKVKCEVEISLKNNGMSHKSKVVSADSTISPNPMSIYVDANGGEMGFHPLCLKLDTLDVFLPNHPLGSGGNFTGTQVRHGKYEMFGKVIYGNEQSKTLSLGKIKLPDDFLNNAKIPNDIQVRIDQGGFAVYLESYQGKIRAKFYGKNNDNDTKDIILNYLEKIPLIDDIIDDNGKLRKWEIITKIINGSVKEVNLTDL